MTSDWALPDFGDPRFGIERIYEAETCRHEGCDQLAAILVDYTMRRDRWVYVYGAGYCAAHVPSEVAKRLAKDAA